jgi:hypothetical protein
LPAEFEFDTFPQWRYEETDVSAPFAALDLDGQELEPYTDPPIGFPGDWSAATLTVSGYRPE